MAYTMSQFCERMGLSRETLRFYEQRHLIIPARKEGSNYRVYQDTDGLDILRIRMMQSFKLSLDEISDQTRSLTLAQQSAHLSEVEQKLEEQLMRVQTELTRVRKNHSFIREAIAADDSVCELQTHGIYKLLMLGEGVTISHRHEEIAAQWIRNMPVCDIGWQIPLSILSAPEDTPVPTQLGLMVLPSYVDEYRLNIRPPVFFYPAGHSIRMMIKTHDPFHITRKELLPLIDYAEANGYRITSDLSGRFSGYTCEDGQGVYYFSARALVK